MLIGVISDSHDDMAQLKKAVDLFNAKKVGHVIHAGDLVSPFTFDVLKGLTCPFIGIFGNNDGDRMMLKQKSRGRIHSQPLMLNAENRRVAVVHEPASVEALAKSGMYDIVIYGHTHMPDLRTIGKTIVLNPGKSAKLHKGKSTVAIFDTATMKVDVIALPVPRLLKRKPVAPKAPEAAATDAPQADAPSTEEPKAE